MDVLSLDSFFSLDGGEVGSSVVEEMGGMPQLNWRGEVLGEWNDTRGQFRDVSQSFILQCESAFPTWIAYTLWYT